MVEWVKIVEDNGWSVKWKRFDKEYSEESYTLDSLEAAIRYILYADGVLK